MIHHVQLACPPGSEPALREFYGGVGMEEDFRPARKAHPGLLVTGLETWAGRLRDAGYPVLFDDEFPGMRRFYSQDPNGNRLEFLEPL